MARLIISVLGPLMVTLDGEPVSGFEYNKVRALLVYLAVEISRPHTRASLAALLWPDLPERTARNNLSQALTKLRQALDLGQQTDIPFLIIQPDSLQLNPANDVEVDTTRFLSILNRAESHAHRSWRTCSQCCEQLRDAIALYHGDFLAQFFLPDSIPFEEWATIQREHLHQRLLSILERLAQREEWQGHYEQAINFIRRQVEMEPLLETNQRALIRLLAISGQKTAALAQYDQFHRMLAHEIGTEPTIETQALVEQINSGDSLRSDSFDAPPLPLPPTRIVGRNTEIQVVTTYLRGENTRALTLTGPPGIGKTRLALEVATQMQFDFEQGTRYIELAPIADANLVPLAIAQAFEIKERAGKTLASILIAALKNHHCLLVLDNFEHVLEAASFIAEVLAACPLVKILITSRSPLGIRAEQQLPLAPLTLPGQINPLAVVTESPAVQLFVERAQAVRPDFAFTAENAADIAEICARLDGLPLAIELIAVRAKTLSPAELLEQLELGLDAFAPNLRDLTERHQTLSNAIAWSYNLLKADEQRVFIYLGVFSGGCTLQAAQEVLSETGLVSSILTSLEALHHASLVQTQNHAGETRFTLLETLRIFALEQLISQGEAEAFHAHQQHSDYFLRLALKAEPELIGPNQKNWFDRLERELANLRAAFKWNLEHLVESSLRLATVLEQFWAVRGYFEEGRHWLKTALRQDAQISISIRAEALTAAGNLAWRQGDYKEAQILLIESRQLFTQAEDANGLARAIYGLGMVAVRQAGYAQAETFFQESLNLARNLQDLYTEACSLNGFGQVKLRQGNRALARTYTEQALALHQARKDPRNTAGLTLNLGVIAYEEGEYEPARNYTETSLKIAHELNDRQIMTVALLNQGNILIAQGSLNAARISLEEAIAIHRVQNDREPMAPALGTLGRVLQKLGDLDAARACQHEALTLRTEADDRRGIAVSLQNLAVLEQSENQAKRAAQLLGAADAIRKAIGSPLNLTAQVEYDQLVVKIQDTLGKAAFESAWGIGRTLSLEQAIELAFDSPSGR